jgi:hypothetical protein
MTRDAMGGTVRAPQTPTGTIAAATSPQGVPCGDDDQPSALHQQAGRDQGPVTEPGDQ